MLCQRGVSIYRFFFLSLECASVCSLFIVYNGESARVSPTVVSKGRTGFSRDKKRKKNAQRK